MFDTGPVYLENHKAVEDIVINQGGTDSGKTYAILQVLLTIITQNEAPADDPIITVLNKSVPDAKKGAYRTFKGIVRKSPYLEALVEDWNRSDRIVTFKTGWIIEFVGATDEQSAKQGKRQYLFVNEADGIAWLIFWQMAKRTRKRVYIDYNPTAPFWVHERLIGTQPSGNDLNATVRLIISDHRHNPFLSKRDHAKTENIKDPELWKVYARGLTGNLSGLIYPNWQQIDDSKFPKNVPIIAGLDFGYTNDPTAGLIAAVVGGSVFFKEVCYEPGITPMNLKQLFAAHGIDANKPIYCEHDPDIVGQLRRLGVQALPARKGQGSIRAGIFKLKEYDIFYTTSSKNLHEERIRYKWKTNPDTGEPLNQPEPGHDHLLDAARYAIYTHFFKG
jgi:phage terminase large subunit